MYEAKQLVKLSQSSCRRFQLDCQKRFFLSVSCESSLFLMQNKFIVFVDINVHDSAKISFKMSGNGEVYTWVTTYCNYLWQLTSKEIVKFNNKARKKITHRNDYLLQHSDVPYKLPSILDLFLPIYKNTKLQNLTATLIIKLKATRCFTLQTKHPQASCSKAG